MYSGLLHPFWVVFLPSNLLTIPPQIWRLFSSFLLTGPKFGIMYDPYFCEQLCGYPRWAYTDKFGKCTRMEADLKQRHPDSHGQLTFTRILSLYGQPFWWATEVLFAPYLFRTPRISARTVSSSCWRFLKMRKITLALRAGPSFAINPKGLPAVWAWWYFLWE